MKPTTLLLIHAFRYMRRIDRSPRSARAERLARIRLDGKRGELLAVYSRPNDRFAEFLAAQPGDRAFMDRLYARARGETE